MSDVQVGRTEKPFIFEVPDTCTVSGKPVRFPKIQSMRVKPHM